ncbi:serine/threonine protein kinase [Ancylothrix sp. C2]|uniref:serine/threonine protein kinase n=1 Tax=Ancylothrix sp. D3o TaxID=2953691 RepID=UPI0021BB143D|nr:serine/threonine-protein kinase [Ancylothrix sp. D3o]MCT7950494.1 serine/threonine protein kinase [Ancylothrix sp. D3o]
MTIPLKAGTVLQNGKYTIDAILGTGIILTCEATQTDLNLPVIIKTLNISSHRSDFDRLQTQFQSLSQKLRQCQHPNVVKVLDNFSENGQIYSVMEYIRGQTLQELLDTGLEISPTLALDYIRQIGNALTELHHQSILHRNIKPQNIKKRQGSNTVILIDFGILDYLRQAEGHQLIPKTDTNDEKTLFGGYAPIEQYLPHTELTTKSDIYSLSGTLYCLLTGSAPLAAPLRERITSPKAIRTFPTEEPSPPPLREIVQSANALGVKSAGTLRTYKNAKRLIQRQSRIEEWLQRWNEFPSNLDPSLEVALKRGLEIDDLNRPASIEAWLALLPQTEQEKQTPAITIEVPHSNETTNPNPLTPLLFGWLKSPTKRAFALTAVIAGFFGISLGLSLRVGLVGQISVEIFDVEQSFPPLEDWPSSEPVEVYGDFETSPEEDLPTQTEQDLETVRGADLETNQ